MNILINLKEMKREIDLNILILYTTLLRNILIHFLSIMNYLILKEEESKLKFKI